MKMWLTMEKGARIRFTGHLDLMRTMQRALRRSGLPVRYSQGFNPHMLLNAAAPLSLGMPGLRELIEVPVSEEIVPEAFQERLNAALPPDLRCRAVRALPDEHPAPMALLRAAQYLMELDGDHPGTATCMAALPAMLAAEELPAVRKTKTGEKPCDVRPMLYEAQAMSPRTICATLSLCEAGTLKPDLFLSVLAGLAGTEKPDAFITRLQMYAMKDGELVRLEEA